MKLGGEGKSLWRGWGSGKFDQIIRNFQATNKNIFKKKKFSSLWALET